MVAAAQNFVMPSAATLRVIEQTYLAELTRDSPIFKLFPITGDDSYLIQWRQWDNFRGMQQARALDTPPEKVDLPALNEYEMAPGQYGDYTPITEAIMTRAARPGVAGQMVTNRGQSIDLTDILAVAKPFLLARELVRIEYIIWQLLLNGTFTVAEPKGAVVERDTYPIQTYSAGTAWSNAASSTPLANMRAIQLLSFGFSTNLGRGATAFMNRVTANSLLGNSNAADFGGKRTQFGATFNDIGAYQQVFMDNDLPGVVIYDGFYYDDTGTPQRFIPNGKMVIIGSRPGDAVVGEYRMTRNWCRQDQAPEAHDIVIDQRSHGQINGDVEYHRGHAGGPVLYFPSSIVSANV